MTDGGDASDLVGVVALAREAVARPDAAAPSDALAAAIRRDLAGDVGGSWRRFAPHVQAVLGDLPSPTDAAIVASLLYVLGGEPDCLDAEPRFVDLAARLRAHPRLGEWARGVLAAIPLAKAIAAVERYPRRAPRVTRGPLPATRDFVARYRGGEHAVWDQLVGYAAAVSLNAEFRDEVAAVAAEIMARVARAAGVRARDGDTALHARMIALVGPLPLSLDACWRAGGVALPGTAELATVLDDYELRIAASHREIVGPLELPIASALPAARFDLVIELPALTLADAVDPVIRGEGVRLVDHLRSCLPDSEPF